MDGVNELYRSMYLSRAFTSELQFNLGRRELNFLHKKRYSPDTGGRHDVTIKTIMTTSLQDWKGNQVTWSARSTVRLAPQQRHLLLWSRTMAMCQREFWGFNWICRHFPVRCEARRQTDCIAVCRTASWYVLQMMIINRYSKSLPGYEDLTARNTKELIKHDLLHTTVVRGSNADKDGCGTLYPNDVIKVLRKVVNFCGKDDIMIFLEQRTNFSRAASPSMSMEYIKTC